MKRQKENIVLIGMSGAGKSTLGVLLAKALGKSFIDTDLLIQQREGMLLQEIIDGKGMAYFMRAEEEAVLNTEPRGCVIATGGSVVYSEKAMEHLRKNGRVVYLAVPYEELCARLSNITTRGIVFRGSRDLGTVYEERLPLYEKYGEIQIECSGRNVESCVEEILCALEENRK